jgi:hypothetical protein
VSEDARDRSFDEVAKCLASGTISRRQALRWIGAAVFGGALASLPGAAWGARLDRNCLNFCRGVFPGDLAAQRECIRQGAQGTGPCYSCTPGIGPGPHFTTPQCGTNETFNPETCECEVVGCSPAGSCGNIQLGCEGDPNCGCLQTVEGIGFCASDGPCDAAQTCTTTADCPAGYACSAVTCCPNVTVCVPPCAGTSGLTAARTAGPTILGG